MPKQHGSNSARGALQTPAAERNKGPILEVLTGVLPAAGTVLEIASGTGQHVVHFAAALPQLHWQPSDPDAELRESVRRHTAASGLANILSPGAAEGAETGAGDGAGIAGSTGGAAAAGVSAGAAAGTGA